MRGLFLSFMALSTVSAQAMALSDPFELLKADLDTLGAWNSPFEGYNGDYRCMVYVSERSANSFKVTYAAGGTEHTFVARRGNMSGVFRTGVNRYEGSGSELKLFDGKFYATIEIDYSCRKEK